MASIEDFAKLDIRVGRITNVEDVEKARKPIYKLTIDFGIEIGVRTILAGIKSFLEKDQLMNRQIACVVNLEPKTIAGIESQGMVLAADDQNGLALMVPSKELENGSKVH